MAYTLKDEYGYIYTFDDALVRVVDDQLLILFGKVVLEYGMYVNYYINADYFKHGAIGSVYWDTEKYGELLSGSGPRRQGWRACGMYFIVFRAGCGDKPVFY